MFGRLYFGPADLRAAVAIVVLSTLPCHGIASETALPGGMMFAENGAEVPTPEIDRLTCDEMSQTLMQISASGYRGVSVVSEDHPDYQIFAYENRLATQHYQDCQVGVVDFTAPRSVFSSGFN